MNGAVYYFLARVCVKSACAIAPINLIDVTYTLRQTYSISVYVYALTEKQKSARRN